MDISQKIKSLPKAELHLHIEGSLSPKRLFQLAEKNQVKIPFNSVLEIEQAYQFHNLQSFLDIYYQGTNVLLEEDDFYQLAVDYLEKCREQNIVHTEIFFDPQSHTQRGIPFETMLAGLKKAFQEYENNFGISYEFIMCFLRHLSEEDAFKTLEMALPFKKDIIGIGLDSSEVGHPPEKFQRVFDMARSEGFLTVAHAGEEGPADYIHQALDLLKVKRVDHGVRCLEDSKLVDRLVRERVPLTVCPLSNIKLKVFEELKDHNLLDLMKSNLMVTINSDDPTYFGGFLEENYLQCFHELDMTFEQMKELARNSFIASFMAENKKQTWLEKINAIH